MSMWLGHLFWHGGRQYALWSREDQLEVRPAQPAQLLGLGLDDHPGLGRRASRRSAALSSPSTSTTHIRQAPKPGSLGS